MLAGMSVSEALTDSTEMTRRHLAPLSLDASYLALLERLQR
jgi:hypothetical protein